jgi:ubiquinone/menaquinone biosynthesis C-methylase UbiE/uncharacterized protein YbaR (Trm112 family)
LTPQRQFAGEGAPYHGPGTAGNLANVRTGRADSSYSGVHVVFVFKHTRERERAFERQHIAKQQQMYLDTDVLVKVADDDGYRKKVQLIERALAGEKGWIVDIGAGTCGEDEYLATKGLKIICTDINDLALALSKTRSKRFDRDNLKYVACDGEQLPFSDGTIAFVLYNESLHHLPSPANSLREAARILKPGGKVFMFEPYAYDPWRRISEFRDRFKGTIEKSFSIKSLRKLCDQANLRVTEIERPNYISVTKLKRLGWTHQVARMAYYSISQALPNIFGMISFVARKKDAEAAAPEAEMKFEDLLRCPSSMSRLKRLSNGYLAIDDPHRRFYPITSEIPLLLASECERVSEETFKNLLQ